MIFGRVFGMIASIALIRYLGVELQGIYAYLTGTVLLCGLAAEFGIMQMLTREMKISGNEGGKFLGNAIILQAVQIFAAVAVVLLYSTFFEERQDIRNYFAYAAPAFLVLYLVNPFQATLNSYEKMYITGIIQGTASILNAVAIFSCIFFKIGITGILISLGLSNVINIIISAMLASRYAVKPEFVFDISTLKKILYMSVPFGLAGVFSYIFMKSDIIVLYRLAGAEQAGLYSAVMRITDLLVTVIILLLGPVYPRLAFVFSSGNITKALKIVNLITKYISGIVSPIVLFAAFFSGEITALVLGKEYDGSESALTVLIWLVFMVPLRGIFSVALNAAKKTFMVTVVYAVVAIVNVTANIMLIPEFGFMASAYINVALNLIAFAVLYLLFNKYVGKTEIRCFSPKIILSSAAMALCLYLVRGMNMYAALAAGFAVYAAALVLTGYIGKGEAEIVRNIFSKSETKDKENGGELL